MTPSRSAVVSELQRLSKEENNFKQLCTVVAQYSSAVAKLRDQADVLAVQLQVLSSNSFPDLPDGNSVPETAQCISQVQDFRTLLVERLDSKVVEALKDSQKECRDTRVNLKKIHVSKARHNQPSTATSLQQAISDHHTRQNDRMWRTMRDYLQTELAFHVKAVELYSTACSRLLGEEQTSREESVTGVSDQGLEDEDEEEEEEDLDHDDED